MTIPASRIVSVNPEVVSSAGTGLLLNGLFLTQNILMPAGKVYGFASAKAVANFFGSASAEAAAASIYFTGFRGSTTKPAAMLFAFYAATARAASLTGGSLAGLTLAQLQAFPASTMKMTINGTTITSASINLSAATSFSNAATLIQAGFSGTVPAVTWQAGNSTFLFTSPTTGVASTITFATTDGTLSTNLKLRSTDGGFISAGTDADTPGGVMDKVTQITQNFATFQTFFEPVLADKQAFQAWSASKNDRWLYQCWDTDAQAIVQGSTTCFGAIALANEYEGVMSVTGDLAFCTATDVFNAVVLAASVAASIDFSRQNGRSTLAFRKNGVNAPTMGDDQKSENALANGYSFYGSYAAADDTLFIFFYNGQLPGSWAWWDSYINQIWFNSQLQKSLLNLLNNIGACSYDPPGYGMIRSTIQDPVAAALNFGAIRAGVTLNEEEIAEVNQQAGLDISGPLQTLGYYVQILDPGADVRLQRGTPIINIWYTDGGAIQKISVASIAVL